MSNIQLDQPRHFRGPVALPNSQWLFNQAKSQAGQDLFVVAMTQGIQNGTWLEIGCGKPIGSNNTYLLEKRLGWSGISIDINRQDQNIITAFEEYWQGFYNGIRKHDWPADAPPFDLCPDQDEIKNMPYFQNFIHRQWADTDLVPHDQRSWKTVRPRTQFFQSDAMTFDYSTLGSRCDYLQIDIDPPANNLALLDKILPHTRFSVITFEHDAWDHSSQSAHARIQSRKILRDHGYEMVISDATVPPGHGIGIGHEPINFEDWWVDPNSIDAGIIKLYQDVQDHGGPKYYYNTLFQNTD